MKTVVCEAFGPPDQLQQIEVPMPEPGADQILVKVAATGIGFVDGLMVQGQYQIKPELPFYPGNEFAGTVASVGPECETELEVGDRVFGFAGAALSDYVVASPNSCCRTPDSIDDATAASLYVNYLTALYGLCNRGQLQAGETVLVLGAAGGVGSSAIAVAKAMGARVIGAASTDSKREAALAAGADAAVDYSQENWRDALRGLTRDSGLDLVYDPVGANVSEPALRSLSPSGRFLVVGFAGGHIPKIALNLTLLKRCSIVGVDWGGEIVANPALKHTLSYDLQAIIADGRLRPAQVTAFPASEFVAAFEALLRGDITGKLVLSR